MKTELLLTFQIGAERYATAIDQVLEIVPLVMLRPLPMAEAWVAGIFDYRGRVTPVIDLCQVFAKRSARQSLSTRIIVMSYPSGRDGHQPLGLIAERVTETVRLDPQAFQEAGVEVASAPFAGSVHSHGDNLLQLVEARNLLPAEVADRLFRCSRGRTAVAARA